MTHVFIDLETIPSQDPAILDAIRKAVAGNFKAPSTLTKEQAAADLGMTDPGEIKFTSKDSMIAKWVARFRDEKAEDVAQEEYRKTCFDGGKGHIAVIGLAFDDARPISGYVEDRDGVFDISLERAVIDLAFERISEHYNPAKDMRPVFVGHNVTGFDLRFLFQRAVVLGIKPPACIPFGARPWDAHVFDTMTAWAGHGNRISLDSLCAALGIEGKGSIDGSQVWPMIQEGRIAEVAEYCRHDVEITRNAFYRLSFAKAA
jgi:DNA polymerase elongation subunit (family B)